MSKVFFISILSLMFVFYIDYGLLGGWTNGCVSICVFRWIEKELISISCAKRSPYFNSVCILCSRFSFFFFFFFSVCLFFFSSVYHSPDTKMNHFSLVHENILQIQPEWLTDCEGSLHFKIAYILKLFPNQMHTKKKKQLKWTSICFYFCLMKYIRYGSLSLWTVFFLFVNSKFKRITNNLKKKKIVYDMK